MLHECVYITPYYNNPGMLEQQVANWSRIEGELRDKLKIIVVDDCSSEDPVPILKQCKFRIRCFRVEQDIPFNMHQCRNIGAYEAGKDVDNRWLFMTDIDIMLTPEAAYTMLSKDLDAGRHYTVERVFAPDMVERKQHINTFLVKRNTFLALGGYDLDLTPVGGGGYGGDSQFIRQLKVVAPVEHLPDVVTIGYGRREREGKPVLPDADTRSYNRAEWHEKYKTALERKKISGDFRSRNPIRTPYERTL